MGGGVQNSILNSRLLFVLNNLYSQTLSFLNNVLALIVLVLGLLSESYSLGRDGVFLSESYSLGRDGVFNHVSYCSTAYAISISLFIYNSVMHNFKTNQPDFTLWLVPFHLLDTQDPLSTSNYRFMPTVNNIPTQSQSLLKQYYHVWSDQAAGG